MKIPRPIGWIVLAVPWLAALSLGGYLLLLHVPPSGVRSFSFALDGQSPWFDVFLPGERTTAPGLQPEGWTGQRIVMDPVYAGVRLPGAYDRLDMTLEARTIRQPLLEIGIRTDPNAMNFEMQPLWSQALESGWRHVATGTVQGYVRDGLPDSALLSTDLDRILLWHATDTVPLWSDDPAPEKTLPVSLRGSTEIYTVPVRGSLSFTIGIQDMNRTSGKNTIGFLVARGDETVWTEALGIGGSLDTRPDHVYEKNIRLTGLEPGVYRLSIQADDDIFIRSVRTDAKRWVVGPRLYAADTVGYSTTTMPLSVWTNSRHLVVETFHKEGKQTVSLGSSLVEVASTHQTFPLDRAANEMDKPQLLSAPRGDVRVVGDGYFAFSKDALFLPQPRRLTDASDPVAEGTDVVLTPYVIPEHTSDGWLKLSSSFDLSDRLEPPKFTLSAPGLLSRAGEVDVRHVGLDFVRPPLSWSDWWLYLRRELAAAWKRL